MHKLARLLFRLCINKSVKRVTIWVWSSIYPNDEEGCLQAQQ